MLAYLISDLSNIQYLMSSPLVWVLLAFQIWMLVDAIRREEWLWAIFIFFFSFLSALLYFFLVYRQAAPMTVQGFELPGSHDRKRIKELEAQIHHLDKAHHHLELGDIYFQQGRLNKALASYEQAHERDSEDPDIQGHLGQCLLLVGKPQEARALLEKVCQQDPKHDYGHSLMGLAEAYMALGETDQAMAAWQRVLQEHTYARARVQLASLYLAKNETDRARAQLREVIQDDAVAPEFQRKRERVWVRKARRMLKTAGG